MSANWEARIYRYNKGKDETVYKSPCLKYLKSKMILWADDWEDIAMIVIVDCDGEEDALFMTFFEESGKPRSGKWRKMIDHYGDQNRVDYLLEFGLDAIYSKPTHYILSAVVRVQFRYHCELILCDSFDEVRIQDFIGNEKRKIYRIDCGFICSEGLYCGFKKAQAMGKYTDQEIWKSGLIGKYWTR